MAAVASAQANISSKNMADAGIESPSITGSTPTNRKLNLTSPSGPHPYHKPPHSPSDSTRGFNNAYINWQNYNTNNSVEVNMAGPNHIPSPPSTMPSSSPRSSVTSSPAEPATHAQEEPTPISFFNSRRPRSQSFAVPAPTSCCPNCGLRRPSTVSDISLSNPNPVSSLTSPTRRPSRPHLPLHLHCPDFCPDDVMPTKLPVSPVSPQSIHKRHHRRRSSLCYAESLVNDGDMLDSGGVPADIKGNWERQAEGIARRVMMREMASGMGPGVVEDAIEEDSE